MVNGETPLCRALVVVLAGSLMFSSTGCAMSRAPSCRADVRLGMGQEEVRRAIGDPDELFPVPGQGSSPEAVIEVWRYGYPMSVIVMVLIGLTLIGLLALPALGAFDTWVFDVGFDRHLKVQTLSEVQRLRR